MSDDGNKAGSRWAGWAVGIALVVIACRGLPAGAAEDLPPEVQQVVLRRIVPAHHLGQPLVVLQTLSQLVARLQPQHVAALDRLLAEHDIPRVARLVTDIRVGMVQQNLGGRLPPPAAAEVALVLADLNDRVTQALAGLRLNPMFKDPLPQPGDIEGFQDLFWKTHVDKNRLMNAWQHARYAILLARQPARVANGRAAKSKGKGDANQPQAKLPDRRRFQQYVTHIEQAYRELVERELELRVQRLELAMRRLEESEDFRERLFAAYAADTDGDLLAKAFPEGADNQDRFRRAALKHSKLPVKVRAMAERGRNHAGSALAKSRLLFDGIHWWVRGRYGRGPAGGGLLKYPEALRSSAAQMALFMPVEMPEPTDPLEGTQQTPEVDRRHHYTWATEQPRFQTQTVYFH